MTVSALITRNDITATASQTVFIYTFRVIEATDMAVYQNGVLLSSGYTVTGVNNTTGGTVVLDVGASAGQIVSLVLAMPLDRTTNYQNSGKFLADDVNEDFDKIYIGAIQNENLNDRSLRLKDVEPPTSGVDMTIPLKADRLGKFLSFNATTGAPEVSLGTGADAYDSAAWSAYNFTGNGSTTAFVLGIVPHSENNTQVYIDGVYQQKDGYSLSGSTITFSVAPPNLSTIEVMVTASLPVGSTSSDLVSYLPAGTGAVATTVQAKLRETVSVKDFGAAGDGVTDDSAAFIAAAALGKPVILIADETYLINSSVTCAQGTGFICEGGVATIKSTATSALVVIAATTVNDIMLENIYFDMPTGVVGYEVNPFEAITVTNLTIKGCHFNEGFHSVYVKDCTDVRILNCESDTPYSFGFYIDDSVTNIWIENCYAHDSAAHDGFKFGSTDNSKKLRYAWIQNCRSENNFRDGIDIAHVDVSNVFINNFSTSGNSLKGIDLKLLTGGVGYNNVFVENCSILVTASQVGASFLASSKADIAKLKDVHFTGLYVVGANNTNTEAILLDSTTDATITGCNIRNCKNAVRLNGTNGTLVRNLTAIACQDPINISSNTGTGCVDSHISDVYCEASTQTDIVTDGADTGTRVVALRGTGDSGTNGINSSSGIAFAPRVFNITSGTKFLMPQHSGALCSDTGAGGNVEYQLPAGIDGLIYYFISNGAALLKIDPDGTEIIQGGTAGQQLEGSGGAHCTLMYHVDKWTIQAKEGTWSYV